MYLLTSVRLTAVRLSSRADVSTIISNTSIGSSGGVGSITQVKRSEEKRLGCRLLPLKNCTLKDGTALLAHVLYTCGSLPVLAW